MPNYVSESWRFFMEIDVDFKNTRVDLVIRVIRGALTGAAERRSEHDDASLGRPRELRSEEHTSELQSH